MTLNPGKCHYMCLDDNEILRSNNFTMKIANKYKFET